jgi:hypothetical protein
VTTLLRLVSLHVIQIASNSERHLLGIKNASCDRNICEKLLFWENEKLNYMRNVLLRCYS